MKTTAIARAKKKKKKERKSFLLSFFSFFYHCFYYYYHNNNAYDKDLLQITDQINPTPAIYFLHSLLRYLFGFHVLMVSLKTAYNSFLFYFWCKYNLYFWTNKRYSLYSAINCFYMQNNKLRLIEQIIFHIRSCAILLDAFKYLSSKGF